MLRSLAAIGTVAILAQGTSWAVAVTQAFLLPGSILGKRALHNNRRQGQKARRGRAARQGQRKARAGKASPEGTMAAQPRTTITTTIPTTTLGGPSYKVSVQTTIPTTTMGGPSYQISVRGKCFVSIQPVRILKILTHQLRIASKHRCWPDANTGHHSVHFITHQSFAFY